MTQVYSLCDNKSEVQDQGKLSIFKANPTCCLDHASLQSVRDTPIGWRDVIGWSLWCIGFVVQFTADVQKRIFAADPRNQGRWINVGLWRLAQHPNYFGEMCNMLIQEIAYV